jgi:hypothetical protein
VGLQPFVFLDCDFRVNVTFAILDIDTLQVVTPEATKVEPPLLARDEQIFLLAVWTANNVAKANSPSRLLLHRPPPFKELSV